ncbi:hypothetical protein OG702_29810 [Streptomyces sp. NBC_01198]|nr:hypothetical protein OG702_29810 [Streptomyces sp. NBC_01198]
MAEDRTTDGTEDTAMAQQQTPAQAAAAAGTSAPAGGRPLGQGPGRLLLWFYGVFTVAALSRSIVQISTKFSDAPLAYVLSLAAGVVYAVITVALWRGGDQARKVALVSCSAELLGVIAVGVLTVADSSAFPDATVWSDFGVGYVFLPLILPVMGLLWLRRAGQPERGTAEGAAPRP